MVCLFQVLKGVDSVIYKVQDLFVVEVMDQLSFLVEFVLEGSSWHSEENVILFLGRAVVFSL